MLAVVSNDTARKSKGGRGRVQCSYERHNCLAARDCVCVCAFLLLFLPFVTSFGWFGKLLLTKKHWQMIFFDFVSFIGVSLYTRRQHVSSICMCALCELRKIWENHGKTNWKLNLSGSEEHAHRARISAEKSHSSCLRTSVRERKSVCWWEDFSARCENEYWKQNRSIDLIYYFMDVQCTLAHFMYVRMQR